MRQTANGKVVANTILESWVQKKSHSLTHSYTRTHASCAQRQFDILSKWQAYLIKSVFCKFRWVKSFPTKVNERERERDQEWKWRMKENEQNDSFTKRVPHQYEPANATKQYKIHKRFESNWNRIDEHFSHYTILLHGNHSTTQRWGLSFPIYPHTRTHTHTYKWIDLFSFLPSLLRTLSFLSFSLFRLQHLFNSYLKTWSLSSITQLLYEMNIHTGSTLLLVIVSFHSATPASSSNQMCKI